MVLVPSPSARITVLALAVGGLVSMLGCPPQQEPVLESNGDPNAELEPKQPDKKAPAQPDEAEDGGGENGPEPEPPADDGGDS
jgi:hypothetical protein